MSNPTTSTIAEQRASLAPFSLYFRPGACSLGPHIVLEWTGLPYELIKAPRDDSYKTINPNGAVPALKTADGTIVLQCSAILQLLAGVADRPDLLGGSSLLERAAVARWAAFFTGDFHPAFFPVFVPNRYTTDESDAAKAAVKAAGIAGVARQLGYLDQHLQGRNYFVGSQPTIVDAYAVPMLRWVGSLMPDGRAGWPAVAAFYDRMMLDAGVVRAMAMQNIT